MEVSLDSILLSMILACLIILAFKAKDTTERVPSPKAPRVRRKLSLVANDYPSQEVFRIVITGGPCAGKTTGINKLAKELSNTMKVLVVPEASTLLVKGGAINNFVGLDNNAQVEFQASLMQLQMALEDAFTQIAASVKEKSMVICDRGLMDGSAYIGPELWQALLDERGWTVVHLRDRRYEAVVHMVTAAAGAEDFYTLSNNEARYEGLEAARVVDEKLQRAWTGHSHLTIVDNSSTKSFEDKIERLLNLTMRYLGVHMSGVRSQKFLIKSEETIPVIEGVQVVKVYIEDTFLKSGPDETARVQKRGQSGSYIYTHSTKKKTEFEEYSVNKCQITAREYILLESQRDLSRKTVKRLRQCFTYNFAYYMIDTYLNVKAGVSVLRVDTPKQVDLKLPASISLVRDVSEDQGYSTHIMSKINWYVSTEDKDIIID